MNLKFYFILLLSSLTLPAHAQLEKRGGYVNLGMVAYNAMKTASTADGSAKLLGTVMPTLGFTLRTQNWAPTISYTVLGHKTATDAATLKLLTLTVPYLLSQGSLEWKTGPGFQLSMMSGNGGTVVLNNGGGTSTFAKPSGSSTSRQLFWMLGVGSDLSSDLRLDADIWVLAPMSTRRSFSLAVNMGYRL